MVTEAPASFRASPYRKARMLDSAKLKPATLRLVPEAVVDLVSSPLALSQLSAAVWASVWSTDTDLLSPTSSLVVSLADTALIADVTPAVALEVRITGTT